MPSRWLIAALLTTGLLAGLHFFALTEFLYWKYRWFDIPMHILGGAAIGVFAVSLIRSYRPFVYVAFVIVAAIAWEIFEVAAHVADVTEANYPLDTVHDILNDALGAICVYVIARFTLWKPVP